MNEKTFYGKDLKEADDYIQESSVHRELGLWFSCGEGKATSDQLKELLAILGKLEHKKVRVLSLDFADNPNLTNSLMVKFVAVLRKLKSLQWLYLDIEGDACADAS